MLSLTGPRSIRFEDMVHTKQCILFEIHKIYKWKASKMTDSVFGIPKDSFRND